MSLLERIDGPDDLRSLRPDQLPALAEEIRTFLVEEVSRTGGHLGPNLGVVELTIAHAPGLRLAARHGRLRHRPPVLRAQAAHRPARLHRAAHPGRPVRLPEPRRVRARRRRELARVDRRCPGPTASPRRVVARRARPAHRRRHRRRRPHRRHGLGGAQQHRRRARPAARHRRQRQRALLRPDQRRAGRPPRDPAHDPRLRALPRLGQAHPGAHPGRRRRDVRDAARDEEGHQGHRRAAGAVRGPRPEVPRPGRRPRRAGRRGARCAGRGLRRPGARARAHPEGPRLRPGHQRRGRPVPRRRRHQPRDRAAARDRRPQLDRRVQRRDGAHRRASAPTSSRSPRRC